MKRKIKKQKNKRQAVNAKFFDFNLLFNYYYGFIKYLLFKKEISFDLKIIIKLNILSHLI